jgi:hypothetical protein
VDIRDLLNQGLTGEEEPPLGAVESLLARGRRARRTRTAMHSVLAAGVAALVAVPAVSALTPGSHVGPGDPPPTPTWCAYLSPIASSPSSTGTCPPSPSATPPGSHPPPTSYSSPTGQFSSSGSGSPR